MDAEPLPDLGPLLDLGRLVDVGRLSASFFRCLLDRVKGRTMKNCPKKTVIAYRKKCQAKGTGLSHYILMDRKAR
jgi:modified peptide precursor CbpA